MITILDCIAIDLAGKALSWVGDKYMLSELKFAEKQTHTTQVTVDLIQNAISNGKIPTDYLNSGSLSRMADYIMGGSPIWIFDEKNNLVIDEKLTKLSQDIFNEWFLPILRKTADDLADQMSKASVDNTGKKDMIKL